MDEFPVPVPSSAPRGMTAGGSSTVWYGTHSTRKIGRVDLTKLAGCQTNASLCMTEYPIPNPANGTDPYNLAKAADGTIWFTEGAGNKIGRLDPNANLVSCMANGSVCITEYTTPGGFPYNISLGPDNNIWFNDNNGIGRVDLTKLKGCDTIPTTCITHWVLSAGSLAGGQDGNVWCLLFSPDRVGRIDLSKVATCLNDISPCLTSFPLPAGSHADNLVPGPDGNIWFTAAGPKVGRVDLSALGGCSTLGSCITEFGVTGSFTNLISLTAGPDGALWFMDYTSNNIGRISSSGQVTNQYAIPTAKSGPQRIRTGPDGNLWFTEGVGKMGRVTLGSGGGNPTPTPTPTPHGPTATPTRTPTGSPVIVPRVGVSPVAVVPPRTNENGRQ